MATFADSNSVQKRTCLTSLTQTTLVSLLIRASNLRPDLPIIASNARPAGLDTSNGTSATFGSAQASTSTPAAAQPPSAIAPPPLNSHNHTIDGELNNPNHDEEDDDDADMDAEAYDDDPPAHYPRPGHGLARTLPPEQDDLQWLVDDNDEVYSHIYQTDPAVANQAVLGADDVMKISLNGKLGKGAGDSLSKERGADEAMVREMTALDGKSQ